MTLGTRVTLAITVMVAIVLGISVIVARQVRSTHLELDVERQAREVADALRADIQPLPADVADETLKNLVWQARQQGRAFQLEILRVGSYKVADQGWLSLVDKVEASSAPFGKQYQDEHTYAMAVPLFDKDGMRVAVLGLKRDTRYIEDELTATLRETFPLLVAVLVLLALGVYVALRSNIVQPVRRLLDGIEAVGKGDLSRVLLAERNDEIGALAGLFNAMTGSLREAREETRRGTEARLALETRLRQSEKLATIGQMAAEIAHEVGTPLNVIGGRARAMAKKASHPAEVDKNAGIIADQVERITKIIRQVLDFSRKSGPTNTDFDLSSVVNEALQFLGDTIRRQRIRTMIRTLPELGRVPGDPDQIQQVCLNLFMNAIHAMPGGGTLTVITERVTRRKEGLDLAPPAAYAVLQIGDTGTGVPATDRERIFEPFFTTKDAGQGTGIGLAVSKGIVKDHDGWIEVDNRAEGGALFRVYLPLAGSSPWQETTPPPPMPAGGDSRA